MKTDVVIPLYRPDEEFIKLITMLNKQTLPVNRIILINTEKALYDEFARKFSFDEEEYGAELIHITAREFDHAGTRHMGMLKSDADVVVMMTQDAIPADVTLLENLTAHLTDGVAVAYARQLPKKNVGLIEQISREFNYPADSSVREEKDIEKLGIKAFFCSDVCAAYRKETYLAVGGFCVPAIFNEDMIFAHNALRAGYKVAYAADAEVYHSHRYTCMQQLHRNFDLGVSQADHPEVFSKVKSESEGMRLVKSAFKRFNRLRRPWLFIPFSVQCAFKLLGYKLGKNYKKLPKGLVKKLTSNKAYWEL